MRAACMRDHPILTEAEANLRIAVFLEFFHHTLFKKTIEHSFSETGSVSFLR
jgi:hypothetical protein